MKSAAIALLMIAVLLGCVHSSTISGETTPAGIRYEGGDGTSCDRAVAILGAKNGVDGLAAERSWVLAHYPGSTLGVQRLIDAGDRQYEKIEFTTAEGKTIELCFDVTAFILLF